jgi:hypothetical protein
MKKGKRRVDDDDDNDEEDAYGDVDGERRQRRRRRGEEDEEDEEDEGFDERDGGGSEDSDDSKAEDEEAFFVACAEGRLEDVERMHAEGIANAAISVEEGDAALAALVDEEGDTPLGVACRFGHLNVAEWLVARGAPVGAANAAGETPLHEACLHGDLALVEWLLGQPGLSDTAAERERRNAQGMTPIGFASLHGHTPIVRALAACAGLAVAGWAVGQNAVPVPVSPNAVPGQPEQPQPAPGAAPGAAPASTPAARKFHESDMRAASASAVCRRVGVSDSRTTRIVKATTSSTSALTISVAMPHTQSVFSGPSVARSLRSRSSTRGPVSAIHAGSRTAAELASAQSVAANWNGRCAATPSRAISLRAMAR